MIIMDPPRKDIFRGRTIRTAHLVSTLHGAEGTAELLTFARQLGMKEEWIQRRGTPREHFDLMGSRCDAAQAAGAVVDRNLLGRTIGEKRAEVTRG